MYFLVITIAYHFDPVAAFSFDPPLTYHNTFVIKRLTQVDWEIGVLSIDELIARGFNIERGNDLDTIELRRSAVDVFSDRQWKYFSIGPPDYYEWETPPAPPSQPPVIIEFTAMPLFTSIVCSYTAENDVGLRTASCEMLNQN
jgi:hypothetical protein